MSKFHNVELDGEIPKTPACGTVLQLEKTEWEYEEDNDALRIYDAPPRPLSDLMSDPSKRLRCSLLDLDLNHDIWTRIWPSERVLMACSVSKALRNKLLGTGSKVGSATAVNLQLGYSHFPTFQILDRSDPYAHLKLFWPAGQFRVVPWVAVVGENGQREAIGHLDDDPTLLASKYNHVFQVMRRLAHLEKRVHVVAWKHQGFLNDLFRYPTSLTNYKIHSAQDYESGCKEIELRRHVIGTLHHAHDYLWGRFVLPMWKGMTELRVSILKLPDLDKFLDDWVHHPIYKRAPTAFKQCRKLDILLPMYLKLNAEPRGDIESLEECVGNLNRLFKETVHVFEEVTLRLHGRFFETNHLFNRMVLGNLDGLFFVIGTKVPLLKYLHLEFPYVMSGVDNPLVLVCLESLLEGLEHNNGHIEHIRIFYEFDDFSDGVKKALSGVFGHCNKLELELLNVRKLLAGDYVTSMDNVLHDIVCDTSAQGKELILHIFERDDFVGIDCYKKENFQQTRVACMAQGVQLKFKKNVLTNAVTELD